MSIETSGSPVTLWCNHVEGLLAPSNSFRVLQHTDYTAGLLVRHATKTWFVGEDSRYEPDIEYERRFGHDESDGYPHMTSGTQWFVDLSGRKFIQREFSGEEGSIQGFVYAVAAMRYGGPLDSEDYVAYIHREAAARIGEEKDWFERLLPKHTTQLDRFLGRNALLPQLRT